MEKLEIISVNVRGLNCVEKKNQETAKGGMTGLQSGNVNTIGKDPPRTNIYAEVNINYCMRLWPWTDKVKDKVTSEGHISLEIIKVYYSHLVKYCVLTYYNHQDKT